jgi:hypothetical protein
MYPVLMSSWRGMMPHYGSWDNKDGKCRFPLSDVLIMTDPSPDEATRKADGEKI